MASPVPVSKMQRKALCDVQAECSSFSSCASATASV